MNITDTYPLLMGTTHPILRERADDIDVFDQSLAALGEDLLKLVVEYDGIWLAWPQVWVQKRIAVVSTLDDNHELLESYIIINPSIIFASDERSIHEEWCLSLPWVYGDVSRPDEITFTYKDVSWRAHKRTLTWFNAKVVQHEIDHLDWILFVDKLVSWL